MASQQRTVIVAVDASKDAKDALFHFIDNFYTSGTRVTIVHCPDMKAEGTLTPPARLLRPEMPFDNWMARWGSEAKASKVIDKYKELMNERYSHVDVAFVVKPSTNPGETLEKLCGELRAKMLVVGRQGTSRSQGRWKDTMGGLARHLVEKAPTAVLVCPYNV